MSKDKIANAFQKLIIEKSISSASIVKLAEACKLRKASLYHHFKSKDEIFHHIVQMVSNDFETQLFNPSKVIVQSELAKQHYFDAISNITKSDGFQAFLCICSEGSILGSELQLHIRLIFSYWLKYVKNKNITAANNPSSHLIIAQLLGSCILSKIFNKSKLLDEISTS
jgi:AcrR family transcriptional regulator